MGEEKGGGRVETSECREKEIIDNISERERERNREREKGRTKEIEQDNG